MDNRETTDRLTVSRTNAEAMERANRAWQLRVAGLSWDAIAKAVGYENKSNAYRAVMHYFDAVPQPDRALLREVARQRGEHLWRRALQAVEKTEGSPAAIRAAVAVLDRHARLDGLDEPARLEVSHPEDELFQDFVAAAARGLGVEIPVEAEIFDDEYMYAEVIEDEDSLPHQD